VCLYPVPNILLPHDIKAQIQQRFAKKPQLDLSKIESEESEESEERDLNSYLAVSIF
jgi:hypothetical protein